MNRLIAAILALVCILSFAGCDADPAGNNSETGNNSANSGTSQDGTSQDGITPGADDIVNEAGNLNIPKPEEGAACEVDGNLWQALLSVDAIRAAMKDNSITTLTSDANADEYQMFFCAGGRYGSIQNGNYRSETIYAVENGTAYEYNKHSADAAWMRTTSSQSYDAYVTNSYIDGAMQFLSGLASLQSKAEYVKAEEAYVIENHVVAMSEDQNLTGTLKIQFANEKLYSISLTMTVEGQTATLNTLFGSVATPEIPTDFTEGNSSSSGISPEHGVGDNGEPKEAVCSESQWQRLFGERLIDRLMDEHVTVKITDGQQEYLYQMGAGFSRIVISTGGGYEEILISHSEYFRRDSKDGQWTFYRNVRDCEAFLNEKTAVLSQLLRPLQDLYNQASFDSASKCFSLVNIAFEHGTFGALTGEYAVTIQGGMLEQIKATFQAAEGTWTLLSERDKGNGIEPPTDYIEDNSKEDGKGK